MSQDASFDDDETVDGNGTPRVRTVAWQLRRDAHVAVCCITVATLAIEVSVAIDGTVTVAHTFASVAEASVWANDHRADLLALGWKADEEPASTAGEATASRDASE